MNKRNLNNTINGEVHIILCTALIKCSSECGERMGAGTGTVHMVTTWEMF